MVGANWGDEGKGKFTDLLAADSDFVVRFQGGSNAGHTIINSYGKFALHMLPSGVFYRHTVNILGPGVAVDIAVLSAELESLTSRGVPMPTVCVSERAQVVLPFHRLFDEYEEERLGRAQFGSTRRGIAPFYADKYLKLGIQVADLYDEPWLRERVGRSLEAKNVLLKHLYNKPQIAVDEVVSTLLDARESLHPFVSDTTALLHEALSEGKRILLEGQLGALRDPDLGIYPYSTSSSPLAGSSCAGAGLPPHEIHSITAVTKAYSTCVGAGPFVTEITGSEGEELRNRGGDCGEFGATTGRPRRVGWFDAVATRYGCRIQGATEVALGLVDVLGYLDEIPICTAYEIEGERTDKFPLSARLEGARPLYETMPGWKRDIKGARSWADLPIEAQRYVERIEGLIATPVRWISTGPDRNAIISRG